MNLLVSHSQDQNYFGSEVQCYGCKENFYWLDSEPICDKPLCSNCDEYTCKHCYVKNNENDYINKYCDHCSIATYYCCMAATGCQTTRCVCKHCVPHSEINVMCHREGCENTILVKDVDPKDFPVLYDCENYCIFCKDCQTDVKSLSNNGKPFYWQLAGNESCYRQKVWIVPKSNFDLKQFVQQGFDPKVLLLEQHATLFEKLREGEFIFHHQHDVLQKIMSSYSSLLEEKSMFTHE